MTAIKQQIIQATELQSTQWLWEKPFPWQESKPTIVTRDGHFTDCAIPAHQSSANW
jgi:hypothetical protein